MLMEKTALELAHMVYSDSLLEAAIGMATINSLLHINLESCAELNARELIAEKGQGKRLVIVGHFPFYLGFVRSLRPCGSSRKIPTKVISMKTRRKA